MDPWKVWTGHEEEFNVVFNYCSVPSWNEFPVHPVIWNRSGRFWIGLAQSRALTSCSYCMFEQGNSHEHQLQLGESSNWLQMGALFEREYKKLIVIHRAIFSEVEPENDEYEIVSRVKKSFENKFSKQSRNCERFHLYLSSFPWNNSTGSLETSCSQD